MEFDCIEPDPQARETRGSSIASNSKVIASPVVSSQQPATSKGPGPGRIAEQQLEHTDRSTLKRILENAVPQTLQDVVIIYASVTGKRQGALFEETDVRKIYPKRICSAHWSAIQVTTASGLCSILDLTLQRKLKGFVTQESFALNDFLNNRFGHYYDSSSLHADRLRRQTGHKTA